MRDEYINRMKCAEWALDYYDKWGNLYLGFPSLMCLEVGVNEKWAWELSREWERYGFIKERDDERIYDVVADMDKYKAEMYRDIEGLIEVYRKIKGRFEY